MLASTRRVKELEDRVAALEDGVAGLHTRVASHIITSEELRDQLLDVIAPMNERLAQQDMMMAEIKQLLLQMMRRGQ